MKNILVIAMLVLFASCKQEPQPPKDYAVIYGTVTNANDSTNLRLFNPETSKSVIVKVNDDGTYRDTLKLLHSMLFIMIFLSFIFRMTWIFK